MKLHTLSAKNFMPYRQGFDLAFPLDDHRNVMIIFGENMRGKTSLLNALRWGFYGEAMGRHSRPIPLHEIVNKDGASVDDWKVEVRIKFEAGGSIYDLRRVSDRRAMVSTPTKAEDFRVEVHLTRDGMVVPGDQVDAEIGLIAPKQISRFFLFDGELLQEYETLLIENDQQGAQIKEAIEQVLGVPALTNGRTDIQTILKQAQKKQTNDLKLTAGLEEQAKRQSELTGKLDVIDKDLEDLNERVRSVREERGVLEDEIEAAQSILSAGKALERNVQQQRFLTDETVKKEAERLDLVAGAWRDLVADALEAKKGALESRRHALLGSIEKRSALSQRAVDLRALLDESTCPTCKQQIGEDRRAELGRALGDLEVELTRLADSTQALGEISTEINELGKIRGTNACERLQQVDLDINRIQVQLTVVENDIEKLKLEVEGYDTAELQRKRVLLNEKIKEEGRLQDDITRQKEQQLGLKEDLAISQKAIEGLTRNRTQRSTLRVSLLNNLNEVFTQSIETLRDKLRSGVQALANEAFKKMTTQKSYRGLEINKNYGLQIIDEAGRYVGIRSAGAEQIVALSLIDGLNRTGRSAGPVIMDTPFGRLDLKHRDNILSYLPTVTSQFVLLVHSGEIRRDTDLAVIAERVGIAYEIKEVSATQSKLERVLS